jgi:plasmid rolling circle replication initiator protein Rep
LSDKASDESFSVFSLSPPSETEQVPEKPSLGDLSTRDKVWDKHKANSDTIAQHYSKSRYSKFSQRINICADLLEFRLAPDQLEGVYKLKLSGARFCRVRHCPVCQWRRSLMWKAKAYKMLPQVTQDCPKHRWLFLTLTVRNCPIQKLRETLEWMNKSFTRLSQLKTWPGEGWIKSTEVTRGKDGSAHPHFHILMMVPASYFSGQDYISQARWSELWQKCLRIDYKPVTHVRAIAKHNDPQVIVPEILKYQVKESDLGADREWFLQLTEQLHKTRAVAVGGVLRKYLKELEQEPEDLIGEDDDLEKVDEGLLYFGWKKQQRKYRLIDS